MSAPSKAAAPSSSLSEGDDGEDDGDSGGDANTVSGNATDRSSPPFVSVPVHGRASDAAEPPPAPPMPNLSAASCNHSGGVRRNDVWFRSTRDAAGAAPEPPPSSRPYSSS